MAKTIERIEEKDIEKIRRKAIKTGKPVKMRDGGGLYLIAKPEGAVGWRFRYTYQGLDKLVSIGPLSAFSIDEAREQAAELSKLVARGEDPSALRKKKKIEEKRSNVSTVQAVAMEWHATQTHLDPETHKTALRRLTLHVFTRIGKRPMDKVESFDLIELLKRIEDMPDTVKKVRGLLGQIWRHAVVHRYVPHDITPAIKGALKKRGKRDKKHFAALTEPRDVGALLRTVHGYKGHPATCAALKLAPLLFQRPGELRHMEWREIDFDGAMWRIPGKKMKMAGDHLVPLSRQVIAILREVEALTGGGKYVFPSARGGNRPMSENTLNGALHTLRYQDKHTAHGWRTTATTLLNELGFNRDWVEAQLSHQDDDEIRRAYNRAAYLADRKVMMQKWADYLDGLRTNNDDKVVGIRSAVTA